MFKCKKYIFEFNIFDHGSTFYHYFEEFDEFSDAHAFFMNIVIFHVGLRFLILILLINIL